MVAEAQQAHELIPVGIVPGRQRLGGLCSMVRPAAAMQNDTKSCSAGCLCPLPEHMGGLGVADLEYETCIVRLLLHDLSGTGVTAVLRSREGMNQATLLLCVGAGGGGG